MNNSTNIKFFQELIFKAYPNTKRNKIAYKQMYQACLNGDVSVENMLETAISNIGKLKKFNTVGMDFIDGSDAKKCSSTIINEKIIFRIRKLQAKKGMLRILGYDSHGNNFFYFKIPSEIVKFQKTITIQISKDGQVISNKYKKYQVNTFYELAT